MFTHTDVTCVHSLLVNIINLDLVVGKCCELSCPSIVISIVRVHQLYSNNRVNIGCSCSGPFSVELLQFCVA